MSVILSQNNYGKSKVRMVKVARHGDRHDLQEITVNIAFEGDFESAHLVGDNHKILPTDTMKNTVYALAKQSPGLEEIEALALIISAINFGATLAVTEIAPWPPISTNCSAVRSSPV